MYLVYLLQGLHILNLKTEFYYLQIIYYNIYMLNNAYFNPPLYPLFYTLVTYLENKLLCSWCESPSLLSLVC
jgi:hypothetical protein